MLIKIQATKIYEGVGNTVPNSINLEATCKWLSDSSSGQWLWITAAGSDWTGGWVGQRLSLDDTSFPAREHEPLDPKWTAVKTSQWPRNVYECRVNRCEWITKLLSGRRLSGHWVLWNLSGETLWRLRDGHCGRAAGTLPCGTATGLTHSHKYMDIIISQNTTQFYAQYVQCISKLYVSAHFRSSSGYSFIA
jgi:hypothetical protein